ncbi:MAG: efflux RND transporter permease subunit [Planctomycetes bacterium]|nr:efflux RND transporter permease subunit [Planctomycetota bacterium]
MIPQFQNPPKFFTCHSIHPLFIAFDTVFSAITNVYPKILSFALSSKLLIITIAFITLVGAWYLSENLGRELIPELSQGSFTINIEKPIGTPLSNTLKTIKKIERIVGSNPRVETMHTITGSSGQVGGGLAEERENIGEVNVSLWQKSDRSVEREVIADLREKLQLLPAVEYKFSRPSYFTYATPIEVEIKGYNLDTLKKLSILVSDRLREIEGIADVKSTIEGGIPEVQIVFNRQKLTQLGLDSNTVATIIRDNVLGNVSTEFSRRDRKIDVRVRVRKSDINSIEDLRNFVINPEGEIPVSLTSVSELKIEEGPGEIRRIDQERVVLISANLVGRDLRNVVNDIERMIKDLRTPSGFIVSISGQNREMLVAFSSMVFAIILAIFLVYIVMASQFESLLHPFVILFTIPFALVGVVFALWITSQPVSILVLVGVVMLAGIVVNNAIVLIDCINLRRKDGMSRREAILEGGKIRLRPILMTTTTTVLGLLPLALGLGEGAELRVSMGITVIGGLLFSTLLTLILVPVAYDIVEKIKESVRT